MKMGGSDISLETCVSNFFSCVQLKQMFSWFTGLRNQKVDSQSPVEEGKSKDDEKDTELFVRFGAAESNILVVGAKRNALLERFFNSIIPMYPEKHFFVPGNAQMRKDDLVSKYVDYERQELDEVLLSQKVSLETYELPPVLLIFEKCVKKGDPTYREVIMKNKEYRFTTVTVVNDVADIDAKLLKKMDMIIFCKDRNRGKMASISRSIWEKKVAKNVPYEKFFSLLMSSIGAMKAGILTKEGLHMMKLGKDSASFTTICEFK